ncbi:MAG: hypothetical protein WAT58_12525 [Candidatus Dormiibacterota bacterium]
MAEVLRVRELRSKVVVPADVLGEAFTKLRYDRRVSPRRDASVALTVFGLVDDNPTLFEWRTATRDDHRKAAALLEKYSDQAFSYVDALVFLAIDGDRAIDQVLTVDGKDFSTYRFTHDVEIRTPEVA